VVTGDPSDTTAPFAINGLNNDATTSYYVGATLPTPVSALKLGASFDYLTDYHQPNGFGGSGNPWALAFYANLQASSKLSLNARAEWAKNYLSTVAGLYSATGPGSASENNAFALTGTIQYNLWANVLTRLEVRWDHASNDIYGGNMSGPGSANTQDNAVMVALQAVYQF
jgi:hypothetical protein